MSFNFAPTTTATGVTGGFTFPGATNATSQAAPTSTFSLGGSGDATKSFGFGLSSSTASPATGLGTNTGAASDPKPGGFSFGATTAATPQATGFGLGQTPSVGLNLTPKTSATAPAAGGGLSLTSTPATTASTGFSLIPSATAQPTAIATSAAATTGLPTFGAAGSGIGLPTTSAAPAASGGFNFGGGTTSSISSTPASITSTPASTSTSTPGFKLGQTSAAPTSTSSAITLPTSLSTTTTTTQSSSLQQSLNFCELEELINKWNLVLEEHEKSFIIQATHVNAWDKLLIDNSDKIIVLNDSVEKVKAEQGALEQELEFITAQHSELDECINALQKDLSKVPQVDVERSQIYSIAENLDTQLKQMSEDLKEVIEHLNEANKAQDPNDPIVQIGRILNAHMNSLQWIEQSTSMINTKLNDITKIHETLKRENERSLPFVYYD